MSAVLKHLLALVGLVGLPKHYGSGAEAYMYIDSAGRTDRPTEALWQWR